MTVNLRIYTTKELKENCNGLMIVYHIKIETFWLEKISDDGRYYDFYSLKQLKKGVDSLKLKYGKVKIIDKEKILDNIKPYEGKL